MKFLRHDHKKTSINGNFSIEQKYQNYYKNSKSIHKTMRYEKKALQMFVSEILLIGN